MNLATGLVLGLIQGLTEFLPVSSSGHLVIAQKLLGFTEAPVVFDILVHSATALAVIVVMFPVIVKVNRDTLLKIIVASLPAAVIGLWLNRQIEILFNSLILVGFSLIVTALILFSAKAFFKTAKKSKLKNSQALFIGIFQALAIIPGISRSGSTIVAGLSQGLKPLSAFNFSFLLSLPVILGAQLLQLTKLTQLNFSDTPFLLAGFTSAFISGLLSLKLLKRFLINKNLNPFAYYCLTLGFLVVFISLT